MWKKAILFNAQHFGSIQRSYQPSFCMPITLGLLRPSIQSNIVVFHQRPQISTALEVPNVNILRTFT